jgi:hypothetical protein
MIDRMSDERLPEVRCSSCGTKLNAATHVGPDDPRPEPGDFSICLDCGHLSAYADDLTLRPLTDAEIIEAAGDKRILATQRLRGEYFKKYPSRQTQGEEK